MRQAVSRTKQSTSTPAEPGGSGPILSVQSVSKRFGDVAALRDVSLDLYPGEVVALAGEAGAGKTTLVKIVSGAHRPDDGVVVFKGRPRTFETPRQARDLGIETIYQDLALARNLDVAENMFLGRELRRRVLGLRVLDRGTMRRQARATLAALGIDVGPLNRPVHDLSGGQRQAVAIARALYWDADLLIMDEPTAALGVTQQGKVKALIGELKARKAAVLVISHDLTETLAISDRIVVLRRGRIIAERRTAETDRDEIVRLMVGG